MRSTWRGKLVGLAAPALAALGCREELGPEPMPTTRVVGRVHKGADPIVGGWIEFYPIEGTVGNLRSAPLKRDGTFEADRVPIGRLAIKIVHPSPPLPPPLQTFERIALIRRDIPPPPEASIDIDLQAEWLRHLREDPSG